MKGRKTKDLLFIAAILLLSIVSLMQIGKLHIDSSTNAFIPQKAPEVRTNEEIEKAFGSLNLYSKDEAILADPSRAVLNSVTKSIGKLSLCSSVTSLTNTDHLGSSDEGLLVQKLYDPTETDALGNLQARLGEWGDLYEGNLHPLAGALSP